MGYSCSLGTFSQQLEDLPGIYPLWGRTYSRHWIELVVGGGMPSYLYDVPRKGWMRCNILERRIGYRMYSFDGRRGTVSRCSLEGAPLIAWLEKRKEVDEC